MMESESAPARADIEAQVERILASSAFEGSDRNRRFLRYVVDETLAGRGGSIKAYTIATTVFGRDEGFDPQADPIVRVEAGRLRRSLERYYLRAGVSDPVVISVPKGSYVPTFEWSSNKSPVRADSSSPVAAPNALDGARQRHSLRRSVPWVTILSLAVLALVWLGWSWSTGVPPFQDRPPRTPALHHGPAILVAPFEDEDAATARPDLSRGLTRETVAALTRFSDLFVFAPETSLRYGATADLDRVRNELGVDYFVTGSLGIASGSFRLLVSLIDAETGRHLWSERFNGSLDPASILEVEEQIADRIVRALAEPYGAIFVAKVGEIAGRPPNSFSSYECVLLFYRYWQRPNPGLFGPARDCLERTVVADPYYAEAHSSLALMYVDAYRFGMDRGTIAGDPLAQALKLAQHAVELAPNAASGYRVLHLVYWFLHDLERSAEAGEKALALNPNNSELLAELGARNCLRQQWERGLPMVQEAFARNPALPDLYRIVFFLHDYIKGDYTGALAEAKSIALPDVIYTHIALAMAYAQLGRKQEAAAAVKRILELDPTYPDQVVRDLEKRNVHPDLIEVIVEGLKKAGLPVTDSQTG